MEPANLDELARRAAGGDSEAESALLADLRVRFAALAKRRVRPDEAEDVVQDALTIVHRKVESRGPGGVLPWALQVLRNVIGNVYQSRRPTEELAPDRTAAPDEDPLALLAADELRARVERAIGGLAESAPRCAGIFRAILRALAEGDEPRAVRAAALEHAREKEPRLEASHFYVILHRCRARLREQMESTR